MSNKSQIQNKPCRDDINSENVSEQTRTPVTATSQKDGRATQEVLTESYGSREQEHGGSTQTAPCPLSPKQQLKLLMDSQK